MTTEPVYPGNGTYWYYLEPTINKTFVSSNVLPRLMHCAHNENITLTIENIATSITNYIRSGPQSVDHYGTVYRTEVYMRVQWAWLAYPVALLSLVSISQW